MTKYILITGGVVSGLGKRIAATSFGCLLKNRGFRVTIQKFDPYFNIDHRTMNLYQHGEVFVTKDSAETDLDVGYYERFIDENLTQNANVTCGRIYDTVLRKERNGEYHGGTVQFIPHVTNDLKKKASLFCNVPPRCVFENKTLKSLYDVPHALDKQGLADVVCEKFGFARKESALSEWNELSQNHSCPKDTTTIAL